MKAGFLLEKTETEVPSRSRKRTAQRAAAVPLAASAPTDRTESAPQQVEHFLIAHPETTGIADDETLARVRRCESETSRRGFFRRARRQK